MDWKLLFSGRILSRGKTYYTKKNVVNYTESGNTINAVVLGSTIYDVRISDPGKPNMKMKCTCPYARDGFNCKHMAAVMFRWEAEEKLDTENRASSAGIAELIPPAPKGEEPFYHISKIISGERFTNRVCSEAKELSGNGSVVLESLARVRSHSRYRISEDKDAPAAVTGFYKPDKGGYRYPLEIRLTPDEIKTFSCSFCGKHYDGYYYYQGEKAALCSHLLVLLVKADGYTKKVDPGDYTDYNGRKFLDAFMKEKTLTASSERESAKGSVRLEPRISQTGDGYELSFRIGNADKLYVVKNLTDLQHTVEKREKLPLGKKGCIDFAAEFFDEKSAMLYELIEAEVRRMEAVEEKMQSRRTYYYGGTLEAGKGIPFTGATADTVYELLNGCYIDIKGLESSSARHLFITDSEPTVGVRIEVKKGKGKTKYGIEGIKVSGTVPVVIDGVRSRYFISEGCLSRLNEDTWSRIKPFAAAADAENSFDFLIGHKQATRFYYDVLPRLKEDPAFIINEVSTAEGLIPAKAEFAFYLDAEDDIIICEAEATYGTVTEKMKLPAADNLPLPPHRDLYQEMPVYDLLQDLFSAYDGTLDAYVLEDSDDARFEILKHGVPRLMAYGEVNSTDAFSRIGIRKTPSFQIGVSVESDLMNLEVVTKDMTYEELASLLLSYKQKKKYHRLKSGAFVDLDENESMESLVSLMESTGADIRDLVKGKIQMPVYRALYLDKMLESHEELVAGRDRHYRNLIRNFKTIRDADFDIPQGIDGELRPYQEYGYKWLRTLENAGFGGILADDMGLGKTLQVLTLLQAFKESHTSEASRISEDPHMSGALRLNALVVCPASVVYNWIEEIHKFAPKLNATAVAGSKPERKKILRSHEDFDILVTSYDLLKRDADLYEDIRFTHEILDEAQFIKNAKAVAAKTVKTIRAEHRFALTGTPIENRLSELWSIFDFLMPGFLYGYEEFRKTFELPISKNSDQVATERLKNMIAPFVLRRKKKDVLKDLPDKLEEIRYAKMEDVQQRVYDGQAVRISRLIEEKGDFNTGKIEILAELTRIRQICCDPHLVFADYDGESAKRQACIDLVVSAAEGGHKMLLFSQFTSMLALLEEDLKREGIAYYKLTGETPKEERMRLVKAFNSDETPVFLISLKAGGTGLNLTGADIVIHYDPWWNLAAQDQATDRAHRIGQTKDVTVFKLIAKDTIEEKIVKLQETKKELADSVLSGEMKSLGSMSKEELLELLS